MRVKRFTHRCTQLHANPRNWMWIFEIEAKHKGAWQANHGHKSRCGSDTHSGDRPEISHDLGDPALVETPGYFFGPALPLHPLQHWSNGVHQIEQLSGLVTDLMHKR